MKKHGIKVGFISAFVKASAYALTKQPTVNPVIECQETIYRDFVNISCCRHIQGPGGASAEKR